MMDVKDWEQVLRVMPRRAKEPYLTFVQTPVSKNKVTKDWAVLDGRGHRLGGVYWYSPWRRYAFFPEPHTAFEAGCLYDIAHFCRGETEARKAERAR